jgi:hypothetical protein
VRLKVHGSLSAARWQAAGISARETSGPGPLSGTSAIVGQMTLMRVTCCSIAFALLQKRTTDVSALRVAWLPASAPSQVSTWVLEAKVATLG